MGGEKEADKGASPRRRRKTPAPRVSVVPMAEFTPDPHNTRMHPTRNRSAIRASIGRFGMARSGVVDGDGVIRAGNGSFEGAIEEGVKSAVVVDVDGDQMVLVRRKNWSPEEAAAYGVTDNKTSDLSDFDYEALAAQIPILREAGIDLRTLGWEEYELQPLEEADWSPPPERKGGLSVDKTRLVDPVRLDLDQRSVFVRAVESMRGEDGRGDWAEGQVLARLARLYLEEPEPTGGEEGTG